MISELIRALLALMKVVEGSSIKVGKILHARSFGVILILVVIVVYGDDALICLLSLTKQ
jgi:hypothetical protein